MVNCYFPVSCHAVNYGLFGEERGAHQVQLAACPIHRRKLIDLVKIGVAGRPSGLAVFYLQCTHPVGGQLLGSVVVAGNAAASNVEGFASTTLNAYYNAAITFTGQSMGAENTTKLTILPECALWLC